MSLVIGFLGAFWHAIAQRRLKTFFVSTVKRSFVVSALKLHHRGAFCSRAISSLGLRLSLLEQFSVASVRRRAFLHHCNKLLDVLDFETRFFRAPTADDEHRNAPSRHTASPTQRGAQAIGAKQQVKRIKHVRHHNIGACQKLSARTFFPHNRNRERGFAEHSDVVETIADTHAAPAPSSRTIVALQALASSRANTRTSTGRSSHSVRTVPNVLAVSTLTWANSVISRMRFATPSIRCPSTAIVPL